MTTTDTFVLYDFIHQALTDHPELRDNDAKLMTYVWRHQLAMSGKLEEWMTGGDLLKLISSGGILASPESIRRSRQKLQQHNFELRGKTYTIRQARQENVKADVREITANEILGKP